MLPMARGYDAAASQGKLVMSDSRTAALLRAVLDRLCAEEPAVDDADIRTDVASRPRDTVEQGQCSPDDLGQIGKAALHQTPTMWR
jgi:hypothetical protein